MDKLLQIIDRLADEKCVLFLKRSFVGGVNGPYHDPETPYRVMAHWIFIFRYEFKRTQENRYREVIRVLADEICAHQEANGTFIVRNKPGKDTVNSVVGAAWIIEGLIEAAKELQEQRYYEVAVSAFFSQPFDDTLGQFLIRESNGEIVGRDVAYNHHLWRAAAGAEINSFKKNEEIERIIRIFLDKSLKTFKTYKSGLIHHHVYNCNPPILLLKATKDYYKQLLLRTMGRASYKYKEEGYQYFNMYGFALLHRYFGDHPIFHSQVFQRAIAYTTDFSHAIELSKNKVEQDGTGMASKISCECNIFGFGYNSPAFELPFVLKEFSKQDHSEDLADLINLQFQLTYDDSKGKFCRNTEDTITLEARMYEYVRSLE